MSDSKAWDLGDAPQAGRPGAQEPGPKRDLEILAIEGCTLLLKPLSPEQAARVLEYLAKRFEQ